jgi:prolyl-tRNA synthetase
LFLAQRSLLKIIGIVREEMNRIGAQEMLLPALNPAEIWQESGRWDVMGENLFRLRDRSGRELCLAMTHEEVMTAIARGELRSYKQLPQIWYQIQTKFRDEQRPKSGLLRVRQFLMKDAYSFDVDEAGLDAAYQKHYGAYSRIFERCGLRPLVVEADSGAMGGSQSHEFMVASDAGEDYVVICKRTGYQANLEKAVSRPSPPAQPDPDGECEPQAERASGAAGTSHIKSQVMIAGGKPHLILLRGDHHLNEAKLASALGAADLREARPEEVFNWLGAKPEFAGPLGVKNMPILADMALAGRRNMFAGANRDGYRLRNVTPDRDFQPLWLDLRKVAPGDTSVDTGDPLDLVKAVEVGHIFKLGRKYSGPMKLRVLDESGREITPVMGCYGIGIERILCAAIESGHDERGIAIAPSIAPFTVVVTPVSYRGEQKETADRIYTQCRALGLDVILDDRDERPGVKFNDADLIGIPFRITLGRKLASGLVDIEDRRGRRSMEAPVEDAAGWVASRLEESEST